jgi:peptidoglycan/LPS O-acetylase OafA/YrhL
MLLALVASLIMASAPAIYYRSLNAVGLPVLVLVLFYLLSDGSLPGTRRLEPVLAPVRRVLSGGFSRYLGDASYGLYLVHLMILIPVAGHLANMSTYAASNSIIRFAICLVIVLPLALGLAWLGHRVIELPGIKLGKMAARSR